MGFYGNIADTTRIHFQFDKIFSSRYAMDQALEEGTDNIFAGRFVLVEYDPDGQYTGMSSVSGFKQTYIARNQSDKPGYTFSTDSNGAVLYGYTGELNVTVNPGQGNANNWNSYYIKDSSNNFHKLASKSDYKSTQTYYTYSYFGTSEDTLENKVQLGEIIRCRDISTGQIKEDYWKCNGEYNIGNTYHVATFESLTSIDNLDHYLANYQIDKDHYGIDVNNNGGHDLFDIRGYDGTVWQKVYSGGKGNFILIAHLSASFPRIILKQDPPSEFPSNVRLLDYDGASVQLNVPTHWGFRIKRAEADENQNYPYSDQWIRQRQQVYNNDNQSYEVQNVNIPADIYLNLGGSDAADQRDYHVFDSHKDLTTANEITLSFTGESGKRYYDDKNNLVTTDILELSIHAPVVGNMIDDGYDLIYGKNIDNSRPRDIEWYDGDSGDVLKQIGNTLIGGKTFNLKTLAGNINTMHNILGQIIIKQNAWPGQEDFKNMSDNYLYEYDNELYRKGKAYSPSIVPEEDYIYDQQTGSKKVKQSDYKLNKYYIQENGEMVPATGDYSPTLANNGGYYLKNINSARYTQIDLTAFSSGDFYYKDGTDYICDNSPNLPLYPDRIYYTNIITTSGRTYGQQEQYISRRFYTMVGNKFVLSTSETPESNTTYYTITATPVNNGDSVLYYRSNCFYVQEIPVGGGVSETWEFSDDSFAFDKSRYTYWVFTFKTTPQYGMTNSGQIAQYYEVDRREQVQLLDNPPPSNIFALINGEYIPYDDIEDLGVINGQNPYTISRVYYTLNVVPYPPGSLYIPGVYYYNNANGDYVLDKQSVTTNRVYFSITDITQVENPFYLPDMYWYYDTTRQEWTKDKSVIMKDVDYYIKDALYVYSDEQNQCPYGYEWSDQATYIPPSITLCTFTSEDTLIKISNIDKENSLYGLILSLSKMYDDTNEVSRDIGTLRGIYNALKDILYQIRTLKPGYVLTVNDFGQIESSDIEISSLTT